MKTLWTGSMMGLVGWLDENWGLVIFALGVVAIGIGIVIQRRDRSVKLGAGEATMPFWSNWFKSDATVAPASSGELTALKLQNETLSKQNAELIRFLHQSRPAVPTPTDHVAPAPPIAALPLPDDAAAPVAPPAAAPASGDVSTFWPHTVNVNGHTVVCNSPAELREYANALKE